MEDRINYFERMLADKQTGLPTLRDEHEKVERYKDETATFERYVATHEHGCTVRQHVPQIKFRTG